MENGAIPVSKPEDKEWGQRVGYVRDIDGIVVRMGSHVVKPTKQDWENVRYCCSFCVYALRKIIFNHFVFLDQMHIIWWKASRIDWPSNGCNHVYNFHPLFRKHLSIPVSYEEHNLFQNYCFHFLDKHHFFFLITLMMGFMWNIIHYYLFSLLTNWRPMQSHSFQSAGKQTNLSNTKQNSLTSANRHRKQCNYVSLSAPLVLPTLEKVCLVLW